jgi:hypothetical protein
MGLGKKQARRPHHAAGPWQILIDPDVVPRRFASLQCDPVAAHVRGGLVNHLK